MMEEEKVAAQLVRLQRKYDEMQHVLGREILGGQLRREKDAEGWFGRLKEAAANFLVVLTVKDTAGNSMPGSIQEKIRGAGFDQFKNDLWRTYIGVILQGRTAFQEFHENEARTDYSFDALDGTLSIQATSQAWNQGNCGDIFLNGRNYAVGLRGVNIVVYDTESGQVLDSIGFDSHEAGNMSFRHLAAEG
ncbi:MAG: hypothetical protein IKH16_10450 [Selenomonadaceae bacterium]|nr:hypothetical protein [Selenomonadaceae bacterium]